MKFELFRKNIHDYYVELAISKTILRKNERDLRQAKKPRCSIESGLIHHALSENKHEWLEDNRLFEL